MPSIALARPLSLALDDGRKFAYPAGFHEDVPPEVADHWYTRHHLVEGNRRSTAEAIAAGAVGVEPSLGLTAGLEEAEARIALLTDELTRATTDLAAERQAHAETRALLEEATAPDGDGAADGAPRGPFSVARGQAGSYKVMKGDELVEGGLSKADAEAKVADLNAAAARG